MNRTDCRTALSRLTTVLALSVAPLTSTAWSSPIGFQVTIEPDDYAQLQALNNVSPHVTLSTGVPPSNSPTFDVLAYSEPLDASTGSKVFSHAGVPFWNTGRIFRMDFHSPATSISLDYIASGFSGASYAGRLEAYSSTGTLVDSYTTTLLGNGQFETMTVAAPAIAYALAYPPLDPFGDLDHLTFSAIPEPSALELAGFATVFATTLTRRNVSRRFVFPTPQFKLK